MNKPFLVLSVCILATINTLIGIGRINKDISVGNVSALTYSGEDLDGGFKRGSTTVKSLCKDYTAVMVGELNLNSSAARNFNTDVAAGAETGLGVLKAKGDVKVSYTWSGNGGESSKLIITANVGVSLSEPTNIETCSGPPCETKCYKSDPCSDLITDRVEELRRRFSLVLLI